MGELNKHPLSELEFHKQTCDVLRIGECPCRASVGHEIDIKVRSLCRPFLDALLEHVGTEICHRSNCSGQRQAKLLELG